VAPKDHVSWEQRLLELLVYRAHHGHVSVPAWPEGGPLGTWVMRQKRKRACGGLSESQIKALSGAGFSWNDRDVMWENQYLALLGFAQRCVFPRLMPMTFPTYLPIYLPSLPTYLSIYLSIYLPTFLPSFLPYLPYLPYLPTYLPTYLLCLPSLPSLPIYLPTYLPAYLST